MPRVDQRFGQRVSRIVQEGGWSQREVARLAGEDLSLGTIQQMALGVVPGPEKVVALAKATGADPNRLLALAGWPFRYDPSVLEDIDESDHRSLVAA